MKTMIHKRLFAIPALRGKRDNFVVCDLPGLVTLTDELLAAGRGYPASSWNGKMSTKQSTECVRSGNLDGVPASDAFLTKLENLVPVTKKYRTIDDVVGSFPNVQAHIAGLPTAMRRRVRLASEAGPLSVFADLTSSASIGAEQLTARGAAILALVRLLSNVRPVELWAICGVGSSGDADAHWLACRLETAPLDLARVAHVMTHPSVPRAMIYQIFMQHFGWVDGWPYGSSEASKRYGAEIVGRIVEPGSQVLFVPPVHEDDQAVTDPEAWIRAQLATYGGAEIAA